MVLSRQNPPKKIFPRKPDSRKKPDVVIPNAGLGRGEKATTDEGKAQRHAERIDRNRKAAEKSREKARDEKKWQIDYIERLKCALRDGNVDQVTLNGLLSEVFVWDECQYDATIAAQGSAPASSPDGQESSESALFPTSKLNNGHDHNTPIFPAMDGAPAQLGTGAQFYDMSTPPMVYTNRMVTDGSEISGPSYQTASQNPSNFASNVTITGGHNVFYGSSANSNSTFANLATNGSAVSYAPSQRAHHKVNSPATSYPSNGFVEHNLDHTNYEYPSEFSQSSLAELQREPNPHLSGEARGSDLYLVPCTSTSASYTASGTDTFCSGPLRGAKDPVLPIWSNPYVDFEKGQPSPEGPFMSEPPSYESEFPF